MGPLDAIAFVAWLGSHTLCGVLGYRAAKRRARSSVVWTISCAVFLIPLIVLVQLPGSAGKPPGVRKEWTLHALAAVFLWFCAFCVGELSIHATGVAFVEAKLLAHWFPAEVVEAPVLGLRGSEGVLELDGEIGSLLAITIIAGAFAALLHRPSWRNVTLLCSIGLFVGILARVTQLVVSVGSWLSKQDTAPHVPSAPVGLALGALFWATVWLALREDSRQSFCSM
jgi:hypothetical protein